MRSFYLTEEQLGDVRELAQSLFNDEDDPRSTSYKRILVRPKIKWLSFVVLFVIPVIISLAIYLISESFFSGQDYNLPVILIFSVAYCCCAAKRITIFIIKVYQRYAPDSIRLRCRFEPSCSEYMIMSIQKYGLIKGLIKGIKRLKRCNVNDGGFDYP